MVDTKRDLSDIIALATPSGNDRISAQDLRDFIISVIGSWWYQEISTDTIIDSDYIVTDINAGSGNIVATLPAAADNTHKVFIFARSDSSGNTVTIATNASETINGTASYTSLTAQYDVVAVVSTGTEWRILWEK